MLLVPRSPPGQGAKVASREFLNPDVPLFDFSFTVFANRVVVTIRRGILQQFDVVTINFDSKHIRAIV